MGRPAQPDAETFRKRGDDLLFKQRDPEEAIAAYRNSLRLNPDGGIAHHDLGMALNDAGDLQGAIAEYREAIRLKPDVLSWRIGLGDMVGRLGDLEGAIAEYREAFRIDPRGGSEPYIALALSHEPSLERAIALYKEVLSLDQDNTLVHSRLCGTLMEKGDLEEAVAQYRHWIHLHPGDPWFHCDLGAALEKKGSLGEALAEYEEAVSMWVVSSKDHIASQVAAWRNSLHCAGDEVFYRLEGASLLEAYGDIAGAIAEYREILHLNIGHVPSLKALHVFAHRKLADAFLAKGFVSKAIAEYRQALSGFPEDPLLHQRLGIALEKAGDGREALEHYREALKLSPENSDYQAACKRLAGEIEQYEN